MIASFLGKDGKTESRESPSTGFIGYAGNNLGEIVAKFYDRAGGSEFLLDLKNVRRRVQKLWDKGHRADVSESVLDNWPSADNSKQSTPT